MTKAVVIANAYFGDDVYVNLPLLKDEEKEIARVAVREMFKKIYRDNYFVVKIAFDNDIPSLVDSRGSVICNRDLICTKTIDKDGVVEYCNRAYSRYGDIYVNGHSLTQEEASLYTIQLGDRSAS